MAPQTEFQKLVGMIRANDELATLRHVPLDGLRQAVNDMCGARVPEGEIEVVAHDLRRAIEGWLPVHRALDGWDPKATPHDHSQELPKRADPSSPRAMPRVGLVAAECERPSVLSGLEPAAPRVRAGWRGPMLLFWAAFLGGAALVLDAVGWVPADALTALAGALSDLVGRLLSGDRLSAGATLAAAGLAGVALTNLWALVRPSRVADA